ncbi:TPA: hypothetical protein JBL19_04350 [Legionella pneumophila]|nr:hypothetical protein [Legionella pneumophila subsp. fraseri]HAT1795700.1 hypothetical protein [Legionella pneumophila]MDW9040833.1 hypothetical protein [Legionella pneumophila subsp. fraseri]MDW9062384.1 hypothetical protein [Legionella pneumophila subsp. fraseri]MDX1861871.1 hypothetical protein [Legionella pneumophila subsp. fraseri]
MNFLFSHMPLTIAVLAFLLGMLMMIATKNQHSKSRRTIATTGFLLSFFGLIALIAILLLTYLPKLR